MCLLLQIPAAAANEYTALMKARKYSEVTAAANAALAKDPVNANALIVKAELLAILSPDTEMDAAIKLAEKCVAAHPRNAECHDSLGGMLGTRAIRKGIMASLGSAGTIRDAFKTAVELDPQNMAARFHLLQYYVQAPGIVGGSTDKAKALAADTAKLNVEGGKMLSAVIEYFDKDSLVAEPMMLKVQPGSNEDIADIQRDILLGIAWRHKNAKKTEDAMRMFREVQKRFPDAEGAPFGMAVIVQEQGKHQDAISLLQQAIALAPAGRFDYHLGLSWQALNDKVKAVAAFEKALAAKPAVNTKQKLDAETRLKTLRA